MSKPRGAAVVLLAGTVVTSLTGCGAAYEEAKVRGSNINSMMALEAVSIALEQHKRAHGTYPPAVTMAELQQGVAPLLDRARTTDRWGEVLVVEVTPDSYTLTSKGDDRAGGPEFGGAVTTPGHSITLKDAVFVQYDASVEQTARKLEAEIAEARKQPASGA